MLKSDSDRGLTKPVVGPSMHSYYSDDEHINYLWPYIKVLDHDIATVPGQFTHVTFAPADVAERCANAAAMYPNGKVQLEMDFFYPREEGPIQVGHAGISDCHHKYWPLVYSVTPSEDKDSCVRVLNNAINLVEDNGGLVSTLLSDGGGAILSAIDQINSERQLAGKPIIKKRRCFAHNIRMPHTKGGGKRGGQGSLCRYLLDHGCPPDVMAKIMSKIILFNYLPDKETFKVATQLLIEEYAPYLDEHVLKNYLDPNDANKIGGRAANEFQGQNGSTQGVERRGGNVKDKITSIVKGMSPTERANPLNILSAVARDSRFRFSKDGVKFATKPSLKDIDKSLVYKLSGWRGRDDLPADLLYMILTDENGDILNSGSCIGQSDASFRVHLPTMSNIYTTLKEMKNEEQRFTSVETFAMQGLAEHDYSSTDYKTWRLVYQHTSAAEKRQLKKKLVEKLKAHTVERLADEDTYGYLLRNGQRLPQSAKGVLFGSNLKIKSLATLRKEKKARDDKIKWLNDQEEKKSAASKTPASPAKAKKRRQKKGGKKKSSNRKKRKKSGPQSEEEEPQISLTFENLGVALDVDVDPDIDIGDLWDVLNVFDADKFDTSEIGAALIIFSTNFDERAQICFLIAISLLAAKFFPTVVGEE